MLTVKHYGRNLAEGVGVEPNTRLRGTSRLAGGPSHRHGSPSKFYLLVPTLRIELRILPYQGSGIPFTYEGITNLSAEI